MKTNLWLVTAATLALAACGSGNEGGSQSATTTETTTETTTAAEATGDNSVGQSAPVNAAQDAAAGVTGLAAATTANNSADSYVTNAALGDLYEITSSKLALEKATSPEVKKYAQQMITDHGATTDMLKSTLAKAGVKVTPPAALDERRQGMIDNLRAASADKFDTTYLDQQTMAHQEALTLHSGFAEDGDNAALKQFASTTTPKIRHHLDMVKQLDRSGADEQTASGKAK